MRRASADKAPTAEDLATLLLEAHLKFLPVFLQTSFQARPDLQEAWYRCAGASRALRVPCAPLADTAWPCSNADGLQLKGFDNFCEFLARATSHNAAPSPQAVHGAPSPSRLDPAAQRGLLVAVNAARPFSPGCTWPTEQVVV